LHLSIQVNQREFFILASLPRAAHYKLTVLTNCAGGVATPVPMTEAMLTSFQQMLYDTQHMSDIPTARERAMEKFKAAHPGYWKRKNAEFYKNNCEQEKNRRKKYYAENSQAQKKYGRDYYAENREEILMKQKKSSTRKEYHRQYYRQLKQRVIDAYGGKCLCCGETHFEFLTIDHINGGGRKDRMKHKGAGFYAHLEKRGFPKQGYRLLCMNCNFALGKYGHCPHQAPL
jgi:hypothetical protein